MNRRDFSINLVASGVGLAFAGGALAQGAPVEGQQYVRLSTPAAFGPLPADKKVEVVEFFWYECPHCYAFEPMLEAWTKRLPADVSFRRVPVGFTARHVLSQKMYYALEDMGKLDPTLHKRIFNAIHQQNKRLLSEADMAAFLGENGVDPAKFTEMYRSFQVSNQSNRAKQLTEAYKIDGVPALGIQGRYWTSGALAGSHERALAVTDYLVERTRKG